jgi:hypothetical protein
MKKKIIVFAVFSALAIITLVGISNDLLFSPVSTKAEQNAPRSFDEINEDIKLNNLNPSYDGSKKIANDLFANLSVLEIPNYVQDTLASDVSLAHLNGSSYINNSNIVSAANDLAGQASAPAYAYTNEEQVRVVRIFLNHLIPDLVKSEGPMNDLAAFAVFVAVVSQKVDNEAFMVTPAEFSANMNQTVSQPFPGSPESLATEIEVIQTTPKMNEMLNVISSYAGSKNMASSNDILNAVGIN